MLKSIQRAKNYISNQNSKLVLNFRIRNWTIGHILINNKFPYVISRSYMNRNIVPSLLQKVQHCTGYYLILYKTIISRREYLVS